MQSCFSCNTATSVSPNIEDGGHSWRLRETKDSYILEPQHGTRTDLLVVYKHAGIVTTHPAEKLHGESSPVRSEL